MEASRSFILDAPAGEPTQSGQHHQQKREREAAPRAAKARKLGTLLDSDDLPPHP
eukprot:SAG25_NODE_44_length_19254_cov_246.998121_12_plen_55_part_00